jgi:site-specific DNA-methyltransferase (adenine-specific)
MKPYYEKDGITIYHADCRDILPSLPKVDLVLTDPPYGHNNNNGDLISRWEAALGKGDYVPERDNRPIANDGIEANELIQWFFKEVARLLKPGGCCCCCCGGGGPDPQFARWSLWLDQYIPFKMCVVWDKGPLGMGWHYRRDWECVLVAQQPGAACKWYGGNEISNVIRGIPRIIPQADDHPTLKPLKLMSKFIQWHTEQGDLVLDPFMGSGTTLRAAKNLGRRAIGIEIEEKYCEIAAKRLSQEVMAL